MPGYSGMTASVDVAYVALDAIRFGVQVMRDVEYSYGFGIGYRIGRDLRIGFNVDHYERTSDVALRAYDGLRHGAVATYGR